MKSRNESSFAYYVEMKKTYFLSSEFLTFSCLLPAGKVFLMGPVSSLLPRQPRTEGLEESVLELRLNRQKQELLKAEDQKKMLSAIWVQLLRALSPRAQGLAGADDRVSSRKLRSTLMEL